MAEKGLQVSGFIDSRMRELAKKMLSKYGAKGTVISTQKGYDNATGKTIEYGQTRFNIDYYIDSDRTDKLRQSSLIEKNESIILIAAIDGKIREQDKIESNTLSTTIIRFNSAWSGAEIALYEAVAIV